jgi:hypothetical protein
VNLLEAFGGMGVVLGGQSLKDVIRKHLLFFLEFTHCSEDGEFYEFFIAKDRIFSVVTFDFVGF